VGDECALGSRRKRCCQSNCADDGWVYFGCHYLWYIR
jgi:hypothetical protein